MLDFFFENNLLICAIFFFLSVSILMMRISLAHRSKIKIQNDLKVEFEIESEMQTSPEIEKTQIEQLEVMDNSLDDCIQEHKQNILVKLDVEFAHSVSENEQLNLSTNNKLENDFGTDSSNESEIQQSEISTLNLENKADDNSNTETILESNFTEDDVQLSFESKRLNAIDMFFEKDAQPTEKNCDLDFFNKLNAYYKHSA